MAGQVKRGDVRLYRFAPPDKERSVLVLTRDSALRFLTYVTVAPITSTIRDIPTEIILDEADGMKTRCAANLDHVQTVPRANLGRRVTGVHPHRLADACRALAFALGCDAASRST
jgi:mRNA interferase MazF